MDLPGQLHIVLHAAYFIVPLALLVAVYRVKLHPLSNYPGPILAQLTDCYGGYHAIAKQTHLNIFDNHETYGPVVRLGPNRLLFNTAQAMRDIYQSPNVTKSYLYIFSRLGGTPSIFSTMEKKHHRQKRHFYSQVLSDRAMADFEPTMLEHIQTFLQLVLKSTQGVDGSRPFDISSHCQRLSFDIIGSLAMGQRLNLQQEEKFRILLRLLIFAKYRVNMIMHFPPLRALNPLLTLIPSRQARDFTNAVKELFTSRESKGPQSQKDLYGWLKEENSDGVFESLPSEIIFFLTAGGTPPATTLSALFFYLARDRDRYSRLVDEIRSTFSSAAEIRTGSLLTSCKYLRACIDESLRINPPSLATLWREQSGASIGDSVTIDGHAIPRGTQVGVNIYALHHNEEYFPDAFSFEPERWLESSKGDGPESSHRRARMHEAFVPFLIGPRACAGKAMVYQEVSLIIAKTLWYFDFERCPGPLGMVGGGEAGKKGGRGRVDEFQMYDVFNSHHQGPNLVFHPRGDLGTELQARGM